MGVPSSPEKILSNKIRGRVDTVLRSHTGFEPVLYSTYLRLTISPTRRLKPHGHLYPHTHLR
ncbi:hypothetical protein J6590_062385 [Homalodisca vitripennis]|nr:hypothetical protein J6590_062385 [Homalodisca vitripennis]